MSLPKKKYFKYGELLSRSVKAKNCFGFEYEHEVFKEQSYRQLTNDVIDYFRENNITKETLISYKDTCRDAGGTDDYGYSWSEKRGGIEVVHW